MPVVGVTEPNLASPALNRAGAGSREGAMHPPGRRLGSAVPGIQVVLLRRLIAWLGVRRCSVLSTQIPTNLGQFCPGIWNLCELPVQAAVKLAGQQPAALVRVCLAAGGWHHRTPPLAIAGKQRLLVVRTRF